MWFLQPSLAILAILFPTNSLAQTYSNCNPINSGACPPDSALGKTVTIDFTKGQSDSFTASGNPTYDSNGLSLTVARSGDAPGLTSRWYIMFGRVDIVMKAAPGAGIVSSSVLQSDDLDEIDWEWLGASPDQVQTNYFGKGITGSYNRGAFQNAPGSQSAYHTYTVDWSASQIVWQIDGQTVRVLTAAEAEPNQYPQTPMQVKIGAWSGGDPSNAPGTIAWAQGPTDYSKGPFTMSVKSVTVADYSTGSQYSYSGTSGNWQNIVAAGGQVNPSGSGGGGAVATNAPAVTSVASGQPMPFATLYPWQKSQTLSTVTYTNYPGLPSGWTVTSTGKVVPPSIAVDRTYINPNKTSLC
jgi:glycosyl hydrolase family 16